MAERTQPADVRVMVADDSATFRRTLCAYLSELPGVEVVGEARDGDEAVAVAAQTDPDIVLLDLSMPRGCGTEAAQRIKGASPGTRVLLLSVIGQRELAHATRTAGADGFVCKADIDTQLLSALGLDETERH